MKPGDVIAILLNRSLVKPGNESDRQATAVVLSLTPGKSVRTVRVLTCGEQNWVGAELPSGQFKTGRNQ